MVYAVRCAGQYYPRTAVAIIIVIIINNKRARVCVWCVYARAAEGRVWVVVRSSQTMTRPSKGCVAPIHRTRDGVPTEAGQESTELSVSILL